MKFKWHWIGYSLLVGSVWAAVPYFLGRISFLEAISYGMAYPGVVFADAIRGESIHGTIWEIPLAFVMNILISTMIVLGGVCVFNLLRKRNPAVRQPNASI
jgi:hypothetical protein